MDPVFLVGLYRSGTTLARNILNVHPEVDLINHGAFGLFKVFEREFLKQNYGITEDRPLGCQYFSIDQKYKELFDRVEIDQNAIDEMYRFIVHDKDIDDNETHPTREWQKAFKEVVRPGSGRQVLRQIYQAIARYKKNSSARWIGMKEITIEQFTAPLIFESGGTAKVIHIIRDPRAVHASRNHSRKFRKESGALRHSMLVVARSWRASVQFRRDHLKMYPRNVMAVQYEELARSPEIVSRKMCEFLEIPYSERLIDSRNFVDEKGDAWNSNSSFEKPAGISTNTIEKWREILPREELALLEYLCRREMLTEGYEPVTSPEEGRESLSQYEEVASEMPTWVVQAGLLMTPENKDKEIQRFLELNPGQ